MKRILSTPSTSTLPSRHLAFIDYDRLHHAHFSEHRLRHRQRETYLNPTVPLLGMDRLTGIGFSSSNALRALPPPLAMSQTIEASSSIVLTTTSTLLSRAIPAVLGTLSYAITSLTSILLPMATQLQRAGETILAAFLLLSLVQAMVALYQYRYDARGQLVFPDGLTFGREDYYGDTSSTNEEPQNDEVVRDNFQAMSVLPNRTEAPFSPSKIDRTDDSSWAAQAIKKLNKSLVLLLPWITQNVHNILTKNTHLFHVGFIIFILDSIIPLMQNGKEDIAAVHNIKTGDETIAQHSITGTANTNISTLLNKRIDPSSNDQDPIRILVIGDSLSVGIGCIEQFDATKDNSVPMALIENTVVGAKSHPNQGPVFPQVLARTLSHDFKRPVEWRSAGVDGGDCYDIRSFCMEVVKQECTEGDGIDVVVALFGLNDLKKQLSVNPLKKIFHRETKDGGTSHFRRGMDMLLSDIHSFAPDALVVLPALPIQPFHKNSIINIFPLGLMVDSVMGLWERQKKIVANSRNNAIYVELKAKEIADWYSQGNGPTPNNSFGIGDDFDDISDDVLLSADGVHPNRRLYAKWAELVGHKLSTHVIPSRDLAEQNQGNLHRREKSAKRKLPQVSVKRTNLEHT